MLESIQYKLIPIEDIPEQARKAVMPETPLPLKMMAAKGLMPLSPTQLLCVWYQLSLMGDEAIVKTVEETVASFDTNILKDMATSESPVEWLDWLSKKTKDDSVLEALILNQATDDATIMDMAAVVNKSLTDLIANNHVRLLRSPDIIEKLYLNPATRMATIDRVLKLAKEKNIELSVLKSAQDAMKLQEEANDEPGLSDEEFEEVIAKAAEESAKEKPAELPLHDIKSLDEQESEQTEEGKQRKLSRQQLIDRMNAPQRVRLALMGSREDRNILLRDTRRIVYMSVIQSPKMTIGEVGGIAASKSMPDDIIGYIAKRRDWVRSYPIVVSLVNNPKCPLGDALAFLKQLRVNDLKFLMKSKSISATLVRQATMLYRAKQS